MVYIADMSIKVALADLAEALDGLGATCFLLTTSEDSVPHPANVRVSFADEQFTVSAGRRSCRNSAERPSVTLLWPARSPEELNLLVDGKASVVSAEDGHVVIKPTNAIWHAQPEG